MALIPPPHESLALTTSDSPTIFVYIPENDSPGGTLTVEDDQGIQIYQGQFDVPQESGILRVKLPTEVNLENNKLYKWQIQLHSNTNDEFLKLKLEPKLTTVGWVEKVTLNEDDFNQQGNTNDLSILAQNGIWHDTLEQVARFTFRKILKMLKSRVNG